MRLQQAAKPESSSRQVRTLSELGLAAAVAHEFRRLLTPAKAYAELALSSSPLSSEASQAVLAILRTTQACEDVLEALVASGGGTDQSSAVVDEVVHRASCENLYVDVPAGLRVAMSPTRLLIVLSNLIANGLRACDSEKSVTISAEHRSTGNTVQIHVSDRGIGMSPDQLRIASKPFVSFAAGSGIGLAICRHLVEEAGGSMWIASTQGRGTCVTVELPAAVAGQLKQSA